VNGGVNTNAGVCPPTAANTGVQCQTTTANTIDNNYDFYQFRVDAAIAPFINPGVYFLYGRNAATALAQGSLDSYYIGLTATGTIGIVRYDFDFVYGVAEGGTTGAFLVAGAPVDVKGWAFDAGVHFPIGPVTINVAGTVASGDEQNGGDSEAFPTISPSWNGPGGLFHIIGSGGAFDVVDVTQDAPTNLWAFGATVDYRPVKQLLTTVGVAAVGFFEKNGNCAFILATNPTGVCAGPGYLRLSGAAVAAGGNGSPKSYLGTEIFLRAGYDVWTGFKVEGMVGWLIPSAGETAGEYILQLLYSF
jgi:hypothetical protein